VADCLVEGDEEETQEVVAEALKSRDPREVINRSLIPGMKEVSRLWDQGEYFLPQVILSSDAMVAGIALCEEKMGRTMERKAKVVTHTAEGDIHDIGQVIVNALLRVAGFDVINLGERELRDQLRSRHLGQGGNPGPGHGRGRTQRPQLVGDAGQVERLKRATS